MCQIWHIRIQKVKEIKLKKFEIGENAMWKSRFNTRFYVYTMIGIVFWFACNKF